MYYCGTLIKRILADTFVGGLICVAPNLLTLNLQYVSKLTERAVFNQLHEHMMANGIYPFFQSAYRQHHSTETALLRVMNDILLKMTSQHVTLLVLLVLCSIYSFSRPF